jgi:hypothetical protein
MRGSDFSASITMLISLVISFFFIFFSFASFSWRVIVIQYVGKGRVKGRRRIRGRKQFVRPTTVHGKNYTYKCIVTGNRKTQMKHRNILYSTKYALPRSVIPHMLRHGFMMNKPSHSISSRLCSWRHRSCAPPPHQ